MLLFAIPDSSWVTISLIIVSKFHRIMTEEIVNSHTSKFCITMLVLISWKASFGSLVVMHYCSDYSNFL